MLKAIAGVRSAAGDDRRSVEERARRDVVARIAQGLMQWASGDGEAPLVELGELPPPGDDTAAAGNDAVDSAGGDYVAPWIETEECTACDECININSAMFAYNEAGKAVITDAKAGSYQDLVKAAEKCTAQVIHPGLPGDRSAPDIERWIARGEKYN
jgi:pyruvate-ferredoxin/flavodoxin oxidoreductase